MFCNMSVRGAHVHMIIFHGQHPPAADVPETFEQLVIPAGTNAFSRRKYLANILDSVDLHQPTVLHNTFSAYLALELRNRWTVRKPKKNIRNLLSMYFTSPAFLCKGHWRGKNNEYRTTLKEWPYFLKTYSWSFIDEYISSHLVDMVTGNSEEVVEGIRRYYRIPAERTTFVSAEIDTDYYCPGPDRRKELNLPQHGPVILYVGKFQRHKGIDTLLKAFDIYAKTNKDARLILLGSLGDTGRVWWFKDLLNSLNSAPQIEIRDSVGSQALRDYYRSSDVFVFPSYHEGSPRVVKEALACGCPVVTSRISGNYAIDPQGEGLVYASHWDPQEYARLIAHVLEDDSFRRQRISAGLKVAKKLSVDAIAKKYLNLYASLF